MTPPSISPAIDHALSVDVEDWYHDGHGRWSGGLAERVERNVEDLLDLFAARGARATLFFLGEVAERHPRLVRRAVAEGHEIASHGYHHRPVPALLRREFREDVKRSVGLLGDVSGAAVAGYRAPYFSIKAGVRWPMDVLRDAGLDYDSSVLPIDRPPGLEVVSPRVPYRHPNGLWEVPVGVFRMLHFWNLPIASGAGLRMVPRRLFDGCLRRFEREVGSGVFYLHPWEVDPESPTAGNPGRWILRVGRDRLVERLDALLASRRFAPIRDVFADRLASEDAT